MYWWDLFRSKFYPQKCSGFLLCWPWHSRMQPSSSRFFVSSHGTCPLLHRLMLKQTMQVSRYRVDGETGPRDRPIMSFAIIHFPQLSNRIVVLLYTMSHRSTGMKSILRLYMRVNLSSCPSDGINQPCLNKFVWSVCLHVACFLKWRQ